MTAYAIVDVDVFDIEDYLLYQKALAPLLEAAGGAVRQALDIPTRAEIRELTEALREAREARPGD